MAQDKERTNSPGQSCSIKVARGVQSQTRVRKRSAQGRVLAEFVQDLYPAGDGYLVNKPASKHPPEYIVP